MHNSLAAAATGLRKLDASIEKGVAPHRGNRAVRALGIYGKLGDQPPLRVLSGGILILGLLGHDSRLARAGVRMIAAHELATAIKSFVKHRIDRERPRNAEGPEDNAVKPGHRRAKAETSFPSGHSAGAIAAARAFGRDYPQYRATATGAAALVGAAQVLRSAHFATDVVAGIAIGWAAEFVVNGAYRAAGRFA